MSRDEGTSVHVATLELLEGPPSAVDAGADVRFVVRAACPLGCDLGAVPLVIEGAGADGAELVPRREEDAGTCDTQILVKAPAEVDPVCWTVRLRERGSVGIPHRCTPLLVETEVAPHRTSIAIWQVPSPFRGSTFSVRVGVKCSARCRLGGQTVRVHADSGEWLGEGVLGSDARPDTDGLYEAEVSLAAPDETGVFFPRVEFGGDTLGLPHEAAEATFSFRSLDPPECTVEVRVVPDASAAPLDGIEVRLGPYGAETDERGVARLGVPKGTHELSVWRIDLHPVSIAVDVSGDVELTLAAPPRSSVDADEGREWM